LLYSARRTVGNTEAYFGGNPGEFREDIQFELTIYTSDS